jgi:hypothetical protein
MDVDLSNVMGILLDLEDTRLWQPKARRLTERVPTTRASRQAVLALATVLGADSKPAAVALLRHLPTLGGAQDSDVAQLIVWARRLYPSADGAFLRLHLPSWAAEYLVAAAITDIGDAATAVSTAVGQSPQTLVSEGAWLKFRKAARTSPALLVRGRLESASGVVNVVADRIRPLPIATRPSSRDFR